MKDVLKVGDRVKVLVADYEAYGTILGLFRNPCSGDLACVRTEMPIRIEGILIWRGWFFVRDLCKVDTESIVSERLKREEAEKAKGKVESESAVFQLGDMVDGLIGFGKAKFKVGDKVYVALSDGKKHPGIISEVDITSDSYYRVTFDEEFKGFTKWDVPKDNIEEVPTKGIYKPKYEVGDIIAYSLTGPTCMGIIKCVCPTQDDFDYSVLSWIPDLKWWQGWVNESEIIGKYDKDGGLNRERAKLERIAADIINKDKAPKFKVGDRVVVNHGEETAHGTFSSWRGDGSNNCYVRLDKQYGEWHGFLYTHTDNLEHERKYKSMTKVFGRYDIHETEDGINITGFSPLDNMMIDIIKDVILVNGKPSLLDDTTAPERRCGNCGHWSIHEIGYGCDLSWFITKYRYRESLETNSKKETQANDGQYCKDWRAKEQKNLTPCRDCIHWGNPDEVCHYHKINKISGDHTCTSWEPKEPEKPKEKNEQDKFRRFTYEDVGKTEEVWHSNIPYKILSHRVFGLPFEKCWVITGEDNKGNQKHFSYKQDFLYVKIEGNSEKSKENWKNIEVSVYHKDKHCRIEDRFFMCRNCDADIYVKKGVVICDQCKTKYKIEEEHILNSESCFSGHVLIESKEGVRL